MAALMAGVLSQNFGANDKAREEAIKSCQSTLGKVLREAGLGGQTLGGGDKDGRKEGEDGDGVPEMAWEGHQAQWRCTSEPCTPLGVVGASRVARDGCNL